MKSANKSKLTFVIAALLLAGGGLAYSQSSLVAEPSVAAAKLETVTFKVEKMHCPTCPITVKNAMQNVEGVQSVDIDLSARTASVLFDPTLTSTDAISAASANAGYPAEIGG